MVALSALSWSSCGTVCNFTSGKPAVYGGVMKDVEFAVSPRQETIPGGKGLAVLWLADICASATADTLTLPYVLYRQAAALGERSAPGGREAWPVQFAGGAVASPPPPRPPLE